MIVASSIKIWTQFRRYFGLQTLSIGAPLAANPIFPPSLLDSTFSIWARLGIKTLRDLYVDSIFASFQQLIDKFLLPKGHFFRYLQVRNFVRSSFPQFPALPGSSDLEAFLKPLSSLKGAISSIYLNIHNLCQGSSIVLKTVWETVLGEVISDDVWEETLRRVHKSSICAGHSFMQCRILHRAHYTKARLARIFDTVSPLCERCQQATANYSHMFWSCSSLAGFWSEIFSTLSKVIGRDVSPNALTALFGVWPFPLTNTFSITIIIVIIIMIYVIYSFINVFTCLFIHPFSLFLDQPIFFVFLLFVFLYFSTICAHLLGLGARGRGVGGWYLFCGMLNLHL